MENYNKKNEIKGIVDKKICKITKTFQINNINEVK
jgi:hypothetical protein